MLQKNYSNLEILRQKTFTHWKHTTLEIGCHSNPKDCLNLNVYCILLDTLRAKSNGCIVGSGF